MRPFGRYGGSELLICLRVTREEVRDVPDVRTGYKFRFVRLKSSDEMPIYVFGQLKSPDERESDFFRVMG